MNCEKCAEQRDYGMNPYVVNAGAVHDTEPELSESCMDRMLSADDGNEYFCLRRDRT